MPDQNSIAIPADTDAQPAVTAMLPLDALLERILEIPGSDSQGKLQLVDLAIPLAAQADRLDLMAKFHRIRAECLGRLSDYPGALDAASQSVQVSQRIGARADEAIGLASIGSAYIQMGVYDKAEPYLLGSLAMLEELDEPYWISIALNYLGILNYHIGDYDQSTGYYLRALAIEEGLQDLPKLGGTLVNLGLIASELADYSGALDYYARSLAIFSETGDRYGEAVALKNQADVHMRLGDYHKALAGYRECLAIATETGERHQQSGALDGLGQVHQKLGQPDEALGFFQESRVLKEEIGDRQGFVESLLSLGMQMIEQGATVAGFAELHQALSAADEIGAMPLLWKTHLALGGAYERTGDPAGALLHYKEFYRIKSEVSSEIANTRLRHLQAQLELEKVAKEAELNRLRAERMAHELDLARKVQLSLLPRSAPAMPGLDIATLCIPALEAGGDYYDFFQLDGNRLGVVIGDVTGKGMPAAIYMTLAKGILKSITTPDASPGQVLSRANRLIYETFSRGSFISMIYAIVDVHAMRLDYACAGHNPLLHLRGGDHVVAPQPGGIALGLARPELFDPLIRPATIRLQTDDTLILYTDGFSEAMDAARQDYGEERLVASAIGQRGDATAILNGIRGDVDRFTGNAPQHDDMTMVVMRVASTGGGNRAIPSGNRR
jgi:serine phosphatase RsbU (regulator of sigma subunit)